MPLSIAAFEGKPFGLSLSKPLAGASTGSA